ncbi:helix-turn-helix domain-containing protein [Sporotomaculum syntrophicum]|nr:helix-turn-helix transcriptional regulator [Sporotomaculum syntrophicum]
MSSIGKNIYMRELRKPSIKIRQVLAKNIRDLRQSANLSQEEFAELCGLHRTYVGAVERAERNVTLSTLEAFATALGVSVADLLREKGVTHNG